MKKNILLLGGLGFIGKNLIAELKDEYNLIVFGRNQGHHSHNYIYYSGDFTKPETIEPIFKNHQIDLVIHAISTTIPASDDIALDIDSNLKSTVNLLELLKKYAVPKIIFLSSGGTVYGLMDGNNNVAEDHATNPISAHGINKLAIEKYIYLYHYLYNIDYLILRLSNPFGENHTSNQQGFINVSLKKIIKGETITIWGDGKIVRDYVYIRDCVKIIHQLINKSISNQTLNIGSSQGYSLNEVLSIIRDKIGDFKVAYTAARNFDVPNIVLNTSKLKSLFDVQLTPITIGIQNTYQWLKQNYE